MFERSRDIESAQRCLEDLSEFFGERADEMYMGFGGHPCNGTALSHDAEQLRFALAQELEVVLRGGNTRGCIPCP